MKNKKQILALCVALAAMLLAICVSTWNQSVNPASEADVELDSTESKTETEADAGNTAVQDDTNETNADEDGFKFEESFDSEDEWGRWRYVTQEEMQQFIGINPKTADCYPLSWEYMGYKANVNDTTVEYAISLLDENGYPVRPENLGVNLMDTKGVDKAFLWIDTTEKMIDRYPNPQDFLWSLVPDAFHDVPQCKDEVLHLAFRTMTGTENPYFVEVPFMLNDDTEHVYEMSVSTFVYSETADYYDYNPVNIWEYKGQGSTSTNWNAEELAAENEIVTDENSVIPAYFNVAGITRVWDCGVNHTTYGRFTYQQGNILWSVRDGGGVISIEDGVGEDWNLIWEK